MKLALSKKLRVAIIGCGRAGEKHLAAVDFFARKKLLQLAAVVDSDSAKAQDFASKSRYGRDIKIYTDHATMLQEIKPDLVMIASPPGFHASAAIDAMGAGADVIVEKPMTLDETEAMAMLLASEKTGKKLIPCLTYRYMPGVTAISEILQSGVYGKILSATVTVRWGHGSDYYEAAPWRGTWSQGGGAITNQTIHALDLLFYLYGALPQSVTAKVAKPHLQIEAAELGFAIFAMADGGLCAVEASTLTSDKLQEASVFFRLEHATLKAGIAAGKISMMFKEDDGYPKPKFLLGEVKKTWKAFGFGALPKIMSAHTMLLGNYLLSLQGGKNITTGIDGLTSLQLVNSWLKSAQTGKTEAFPVEGFSLREMEI